MPRFQFSLRTLFIVVTLSAIGCWVGSQYRIVAHRKAMLEWIREYGMAETHSDWGRDVPDPSPPNQIRRWFGDESVTFIFIREGKTPYEFREIEDCFPEATVYKP